MRSIFIFFASLPVCAQTLQISPVTGARGDEVVVNISLDVPSAQSPSVLQWDTIFPAQLLEVSGAGPEAARAVIDAGKSLACAKRQPYSYTCLLAGGRASIPNGTIATIRFKIRATAETASSALRIEKAEGATADLRKITIPDAQASVTVR